MGVTRPTGKLGRQPAKRLALKFIHEYAVLPAVTLPIDVSGGIVDWGMLGNDQAGDCSFAGETHYEMATAAAGGAAPGPQLTTAQELAAYFAYTGGQDVGANLADVLLYWYKAGKIKAFAPVDHTDPAAMDAAMAAFDCLYVGVNLTNHDERDFADHQPWSSITPNPDLGHCIVKVKSDATFDGWVTWGAIQQSTKGWTAACVEEAWVIITTEDLRATKINLAALRADIDALGGTGGTPAPAPVPVPTPVPAPTPAPVPDPGVLRQIRDRIDRIIAYIRQGGPVKVVEGELVALVVWLNQHGI